MSGNKVIAYKYNKNDELFRTDTLNTGTAVVIYKNDKNGNQLVTVNPKNCKVSFTYDAEGLRTSKPVNGEKTVFVWDEGQLVLELSESGKVQKWYIRGNDLVYADEGDNTEK